MFLRQFKYMIAVVEERHFGRAAERCHVTQPSLSTAIKQLELEIGAPIFLRGRGQRFQGLTAEGKKVERWARAVLAHCQAMREEISSMSNNLKGYLRIGAMPSMSPVLPSLLSRVSEKHPGIVIDISFIGNEKMRLGLNEFSLDAAFTYMEASDMGRRNTQSVYSEKLSLLVPDTEEFAQRSTITWREASELPLAMLRPKLHERTFVDGIFAKTGCTPEPKVISESILHLMFQVQHAGLCTIVPSHFATLPGTRALNLVDPVATQEIALFWAEGEAVLPMVKALVSIIKQMTASGELANQLNNRLQHPMNGGSLVRASPMPKAEKPAAKPQRRKLPSSTAKPPKPFGGTSTQKPKRRDDEALEGMGAG
ncbi:LysR family transcriptional regulator [Hyphomicrobium sp.]|uniref:LysR family transcriptional regulator n=1 Tax=Hyphomicrobium sp. TaxID=82 RepID=UPI002FDEC7F1